MQIQQNRRHFLAGLTAASTAGLVFRTTPIRAQPRHEVAGVRTQTSSDGHELQTFGSGMAVDLALVLAVDCSASVDEADFRLQMDGIAAALRNPALSGAVAAGPFGQIALALVQWSSRDSQDVTIAWRIVGTRRDLAAVAEETERATRHWHPGGTGLAAAVDFSTTFLSTLPIAARRRVIDVSGDGMDNMGGDSVRARNHAMALGITINGLPIVNGSRGLEAYYRNLVIGGPGCFVLPAADITAFRDAMTQKLLREVTGERLAQAHAGAPGNVS